MFSQGVTLHKRENVMKWVFGLVEKWQMIKMNILIINNILGYVSLFPTDCRGNL